MKLLAAAPMYVAVESAVLIFALYTREPFRQFPSMGQGSKFLFELCSSHQDCYVHKFSDDYVDVR